MPPVPPPSSPAALSPGLTRVHGNQPEALRDLIVSWMQRHPLLPLEQEIVLVQSNGIAQWLRLALAEPVTAGGAGIAAALDLCLPSRFLWRAYRAVLGRDAVPEVSPFDEARLLWRLFRLLPECLDDPRFAPLAGYLANDADLQKRYQLAQRLADLFDQYQVYRADWLAAWAAGDDVLLRAGGERLPLPADARWQAELWRALCGDIRCVTDPVALLQPGRAEVHAAFLERVRCWGDTPAPPLPRRIIVFGISSLPRQSIEVLAALARWSQILVCVHDPCRYYWADIVADQALLRRVAGRPRRPGLSVDLTPEALHQQVPPLLAAWGKQGRDFIGLLEELGDEEAASGAPGDPGGGAGRRIDLFVSHGTQTLLNCLQEDILDLAAPAEAVSRWPLLSAADTSLRFHVCHSAQREVEVLHDTLLAAFAADPTLTARDIIVMVPDITAYAPHLAAVFGLYPRPDPRHIPFAIADLGRRARDPLLVALEQLLQLPGGRLAVSDVLDLLDVPALRACFGIAETSLPLLRRWIEAANIRWGLSAAHREHLGIPGAPEQNSWMFGLRRILLGYAVGDSDQSWQGIEPCAEIGGLDAALAGPLALLIERLNQTWQQLAQPHSPREWHVLLTRLLADYFQPEDETDAYTLQQLDAALGAWLDACEAAALETLETPLPLRIVAEHWLAGFDEGGLGQRFFAGAVTCATLMPMRAIPFRMVCLLGMNDGDFPRRRPPSDFDLMAQDYRPGDRSRREDDRYLFLEALLSARERLHLSWVGRSINDNTARPPSVLVSQLRECVARCGCLAADSGEGTASGAALLAALTTEHRLQPFAPQYFAGSTPDAAYFTYAREWRISARREIPAAGKLPSPQREETLSLKDLTTFIRHPVRTFFRERLAVYLEHEESSSTDQEPFASDALGLWQMRDELIRAQRIALQQGGDRVAALTASLARMQRRGDLPVGSFADHAAARLAEGMDDLFDRYTAALARWPQEAKQSAGVIRHNGPAGLLLADRITDLRLDASGANGATGRVVLDSSDLVKKNQYRAERALNHWITHLALNAAGTACTSEIISPVGSITFTPLEADEAGQRLDACIAAWHEGRRAPLPLACKAAFAYLRAKPGEAWVQARLAYDGTDFKQGEVLNDPYLQRAFPDFAALTADGRFSDLAQTLYAPLLAAMPVKASSRSAGEDA